MTLAPRLRASILRDSRAGVGVYHVASDAWLMPSEVGAVIRTRLVNLERKAKSGACRNCGARRK